LNHEGREGRSRACCKAAKKLFQKMVFVDLSQVLVFVLFVVILGR